jgi:predicted cobalt transporter CbtA
MPPVFDRSMSVTTGDLIVAIGMLLLYVEVVKAARPGGKGVVDHLLSFIVFVAMAAELVLVPRATASPSATSTLLLLTVLGFVDVIAGLSIRPVHQQIVLERTERATG